MGIEYEGHENPGMRFASRTFSSVIVSCRHDDNGTGTKREAAYLLRCGRTTSAARKFARAVAKADGRNCSGEGWHGSEGFCYYRFVLYAIVIMILAFSDFR